MPKVVTRTFKTKTATCIVFENGEIKSRTFDCTDVRCSKGTDIPSIEFVRKRYETDDMKIVDIVEVRYDEVSYEMSVEEFLKYATVKAVSE